MFDRIFIEEKVYFSGDLHHLGTPFVPEAASAGILCEIRDRVSGNMEGAFKFTYVGMIMFKDTLIYVLPKYVDPELVPQDELKEKYPLMYNRILSGFIRSDKFSGPFSNADLRSSSVFGTYIKLLDYYSSSGIYVAERVRASNSYEDSVNWNATIELCSPIFLKKNPCYIDVYSSRKETDNTHIITELQKQATEIAYRRLGQYLNEYSFDLDAEPVLEMYTVDYLLNVINKRLAESYNDNDVHLLNLLLDFLAGITDAEDEKISLFGTTTFWYIWQEACAAIITSRIKAEKLKKKYFSPATWYIDAGEYKGSGKLDPDIIAEEDGKIYLLDAKYYTPVFKDGRASGEPGSESITKQILYELLVTAKQEEQKKKLYNFFIMPQLDNLHNDSLREISDEYLKGYVDFQSEYIPAIRLLFLPVHKVFNTYLQSRTVAINISLPEISSER